MLRYSLAVMGAGLITQALADGRTQLPFSLLFTGLLAFTYRELGTTREGTPRPVALPAVGILLVNLGYLASAWALNRDVFQPDGPMNAHQRLAALLAPTARPTRIYAEKHAQQTMAMLLGFPDRRQASFQALPRDGAIALAPGTRQMVYLRLDDYAGAHTNFGTPVPAFVDNPPRGWKEVAKFDPFAALYEVQPASSSGVASRQSASGPP